jgi:peptide/nickel transport system permease protein
MTMQPELDQAVAQAEVGMTGGAAAGRGSVSLADGSWRRIRRSKVALISLAFIVFLILLAIFAPLIAGIEGQDPYTFHNSNTVLDDGSISFTPGLPLPGYMYPPATHWLGVEPQSGRDIFARLAYGARVSLTIAICATLVSVVFRTVLGAMAAYFGGFLDSLISRGMDLLLAFPILLFSLTLTPILQSRLSNTFLGTACPSCRWS